MYMQKSHLANLVDTWKGLDEYRALWCIRKMRYIKGKHMAAVQNASTTWSDFAIFFTSIEHEEYHKIDRVRCGIAEQPCAHDNWIRCENVHLM